MDSFRQSGWDGEVGMKKDYIVELKEEEADELMNEHWVGELVRCKDCKWFEMPRFGERGFCRQLDIVTETIWFCADGVKRE